MKKLNDYLLDDYFINENKRLSSEDIEELRKIYIGKKVKINNLKGEEKYSGNDYDGKTGEITYIDDMGYFHGTWGGVSLIPNEDDFVIIN